MDIGWTYCHTDDFHKSFLFELSTQLEAEADKITGLKQFEKYGFQLILGMRDLEIAIEKNRVSAIIELVTPISFSFPVRFFWKSDEIENLANAFKTDVSNKQITFSWGDNFPLDKVMEFCKPKKIKEKEKTGYEFDIEYFIYSLPDLELIFHFSKEIDYELFIKINKFSTNFGNEWNSKNKQRIIYVGTFSHIDDSTDYHLGFDLHSETHTRSISKFIKDFSLQFKEIG